jgi:hypothetical protein
MKLDFKLNILPQPETTSLLPLIPPNGFLAPFVDYSGMVDNLIFLSHPIFGPYVEKSQIIANAITQADIINLKNFIYYFGKFYFENRLVVVDSFPTIQDYVINALQFGIGLMTNYTLVYGIVGNDYDVQTAFASTYLLCTVTENIFTINIYPFNNTLILPSINNTEPKNMIIVFTMLKFSNYFDLLQYNSKVKEYNTLCIKSLKPLLRKRNHERFCHDMTVSSRFIYETIEVIYKYYVQFVQDMINQTDMNMLVMSELQKFDPFTIPNTPNIINVDLNITVYLELYRKHNTKYVLEFTLTMYKDVISALVYPIFLTKFTRDKMILSFPNSQKNDSCDEKNDLNNDLNNEEK